MSTFAPRVVTVGVTATSAGTASAAATLPVTSTGEAPRTVEVVSNTVAYIKFGGASVAATANDIMVSSTPRRFNVMGLGGYFSIIWETAAAKVNILALEH